MAQETWYVWRILDTNQVDFGRYYPTDRQIAILAKCTSRAEAEMQYYKLR
jgi:hypothetical protein